MKTIYKCGGCQSEISDSAKFCNHCGSMFDESIQEKADAINAYGRLAKAKAYAELAQEYISDREYNNGRYLKDYKIILKKYGLEAKVNALIEKEDEDDIDPAGGHGLSSHE